MTNGQSWNPIYQKLNQEDGLDSQLACSYECDLGGAMFWMCLEPGDFPAWAFPLTYFRPWRYQGVWERINPYLRAWMRLQRTVLAALVPLWLRLSQ